MRACALTFVLSITLAANGVGAQAVMPPDPDAILDLLVWGIHMAIDPSAYPEEIRAQVNAHLERARAYRPSSSAPDGHGLEQMVRDARIGYERRLAAVTTDPRAASVAREYVEQLHPCYEWEGFSDCPAREARFADEYINEHVDSPLIGYLPLLAAHRWLCAAELFDFEKNADEAAHANQRYAVRLAQARRSNNMLIRMAAERLAARHSCFGAR